jgi:hypothetical protein
MDNPLGMNTTHTGKDLSTNLFYHGKFVLVLGKGNPIDNLLKVKWDIFKDQILNQSSIWSLGVKNLMKFNNIFILLNLLKYLYFPAHYIRNFEGSF